MKISPLSVPMHKNLPSKNLLLLLIFSLFLFFSCSSNGIFYTVSHRTKVVIKNSIITGSTPDSIIFDQSTHSYFLSAKSLFQGSTNWHWSKVSLPSGYTLARSVALVNHTIYVICTNNAGFGNVFTYNPQNKQFHNLNVSFHKGEQLLHFVSDSGVDPADKKNLLLTTATETDIPHDGPVQKRVYYLNQQSHTFLPLNSINQVNRNSTPITHMVHYQGSYYLMNATTIFKGGDALNQRIEDNFQVFFTSAEGMSAYHLANLNFTFLYQDPSFSTKKYSTLLLGTNNGYAFVYAPSLGHSHSQNLGSNISRWQLLTGQFLASNPYYNSYLPVDFSFIGKIDNTLVMGTTANGFYEIGKNSSGQFTYNSPSAIVSSSSYGSTSINESDILFLCKLNGVLFIAVQAQSESQRGLWTVDSNKNLTLQ